MDGLNYPHSALGSVPLIQKSAEAFQDPTTINLVKQVSTKAPFHVPSFGDLHIALIDCGVKEGILRSLSQRGASVTV